MYSTCIKNTYFILFVEKEQGLVFHHTSKELLLLDQMSVWLLQQIESGVNQSYLETLLQQELAIAPHLAVDTISSLFDLYSSKSPSGLYAKTEFPEVGTKAVWVDQIEIKITIDLGCCTAAITSDNKDLLEALARLLQPIVSHTQDVDYCVQLKSDKQSTVLYVNGIEIETFDSVNTIVPAIISRIQVLAYQSQDYLFCFHGGAVSYNDCCVIFPGISGAGKSTLTAKLCANQASLYSDEMVVIDTDSKLKTIPLPIAVKRGSWSVLKDEYPELAFAQVFDREDGKKIKYIWPKRYALETQKEQKVIVINPEFSNAIEGDQTFEEQSVSMIDTLQTMTKSGHQVGTELDLEAVSKLLDMLNTASCYRIRYEESDSACQFVETLCILNIESTTNQLRSSELN